MFHNFVFDCQVEILIILQRPDNYNYIVTLAIRNT